MTILVVDTCLSQTGIDMSQPQPPSQRRPSLQPPSLKGLLVAQFLGAFNDNALKLFMALLAIRTLAGQLGEGTVELQIAAQSQTTLAFVVFTLPLMLFSLPAAWLADRWSKRRILVTTKAAEVGLMLAGTGALWLQPGGGILGLIVLACMGAQSAVFSPAKYGILPELLPKDRLAAGNGVLELWTFIAIIAGTAAGGLLLEQAGAQPWIAGAVLTLLALAGFAAVLHVPHVPAARSDGSIGTICREAWSAIRADRVLKLAIAGSVVFWGAASLISQDTLVYARTTLGLDAATAGLPLAVTGLGIGLGSFMVGRFSRGVVELGWIPLGSIGLATASLALGAVGPGLTGTLLWLAVLGVASGFVVVPLNTLLQVCAPAACRGAVIALSNAVIFAGILAGSLGADVMSHAGLSPQQIFLGAAVAVGAGTAWALWLLPHAGLRLLLVLLTHGVYRLRIRGRDHVPATGGALLVANHMSFVDGLLLMASIDRPVRFLVDKTYYDKPLLRPLMRLLAAVPIAANDSPRALLQSMRAAGAHLDAGELVCIFAEGQISRTGQLLPFQRGLERLVKGRDVPIVPLYLDQVWGSAFSFAHRRGANRLFCPLPRPVTVCFGTPMPANSDRRDVHEAVRELGSEAWEERRAKALPLHTEVVRATRRAPWRFAAADGQRPRVSRLGLLAAAVALARALRLPWRGQQRIGVLLPPSVAGAAAGLAASLTGRTTVHLNYTAGATALASCIQQAGLRTVLTCREFLEKAKVALPDGVQPLWIEDIMPRLNRRARLTAAVLALFAPVRWLERACGATRRQTGDDVAAVIFSSGSTGEPKGVELTHFNIAANASGTSQVLPLSRADRLLGILPLFHSFGTLTLWLALRRGIGTVFHSNPLDAVAVGDLVERYRATVVLATPTFLQLYLRRCRPGQFGSVRLLVTGAEKLPARLADEFEATFGIRPLEGYGATECSPVIAVGTVDHREPGFYQAGHRRGAVGQPLPGIALRVVDPDTFVPVERGAPGMLLVRGPNVMRGYLDRPDLTAEVMHDGWYVTGDIARVDDDGYLHITDRLARFSKIGGEMVPHGLVETALHEAANRTDSTFAVTGVPCARKGEKIAVLHTLPPEQVPAVLDALGQQGLPNLFVPRIGDFVAVDELPLLGTGKLDLRAVRQVATAALAGATTTQ